MSKKFWPIFHSKLFYQMYQYFFVLQCDMFKAFVYFNNSCKLDFFLQQRDGLLHTCATWSRLPSTINTLGCFVDRTVIYILHQVGRMTKITRNRIECHYIFWYKFMYFTQLWILLSNFILIWSGIMKNIFIYLLWLKNESIERRKKT